MPKKRRGDAGRVSKAFGAALRERRAVLGLSQESLAARAGLDRTYVGGLERGERNPTLRVIWQLAESLDVPASQLLAHAEGLLLHG